MPVFLLALVGIAWIVARNVRLRGSAPTDGRRAALAAADRDLAVGATLAAGWLGLWGLYGMYYWTAQTSAGAGSTLQVVRFFVPALAPIALLAAWPLGRAPRRLAGAALVAFFALGLWSFTAIRTGELVTSGGLPPGQSLSSVDRGDAAGAPSPPGRQAPEPPAGANPP